MSSCTIRTKEAKLMYQQDPDDFYIFAAIFWLLIFWIIVGWWLLK